MPPPAKEEEKWFILAGIPKVVTDNEAERTFPPGADISVACNEPPRASVVTVPRFVSLPPSHTKYSYVVAADDRSGLLLLRATNHSRTPYHLCDARTGKVVALSLLMGPQGLHGANAGLITRDDADCMVAKLQPDCDGSGRATLIRYKVGECNWVRTEVTYSPPLSRDWFCDGVVNHHNMLWWVDLSYGLLVCDPFSDATELLYVPLPWIHDEPPSEPIRRCAHRCVKVSGGRLRCVQIHGNPDAPVVSMWALADPARAGEWVPERSVAMAEVWADESYLDTMLPWSVPNLALLHPTDPDRVYFFLESSIFAVDLRRRKVVEFSEFVIPDRPLKLKLSSHFVQAWQYDPSSSTRSGFVSTCLRQEKRNQSSLSCLMPTPRAIAKRMQRDWDIADARMTEDRRAKIASHVFKSISRISEEKQNQHWDQAAATRLKTAIDDLRRRRIISEEEQHQLALKLGG